MLILRIKQAECALRDGRLDAAYQQAIRPEVAQHRRGQTLISQLITQLSSRCRVHLADSRLDAAAADCQQLARLGGNQPELMQLRREVEDAVRRQAEARRRREGARDAACDVIRHGDLTLGEKLLDAMDTDDSSRDHLRQQIAQQRNRVDTALAKARRALETGDVEQLVGQIVQARRLQPNHVDLSELVRQATEAMLPSLRQATNTGRLDQAAQLMTHLDQLAGANSPEVTDIRAAIQLFRQAAGQVHAGRLSSAARTLSRASQLLPTVDWLNDAAAQAKSAADGIESLETGPLGLLDVAASASAVGPSIASPSAGSVVDAVPVGDVLPRRFIVHVDGAQSALVVRNDSTTLGPAGSSRRPDVSLVGMTQCRLARIERVDDDYFLRSETEVEINGRLRREKLLSHDDRIALGRRCRVTFQMPSASSTSAVLDFTADALPRRDIRRIVLMDDAILIGRGRGAHLRVPDADESIVLFQRGDQLVCRANNATHRVVVGQPLHLGSISLVVSGVSGGAIGAV